MPIAKGSLVPGTPVTPDPEDSGPIPTRRVIAEPGTYEPTWYPPDGLSVLPLNPPGELFGSLKANSGLGAVPVELIESDNPYGGTYVDWTRPLKREILWPMRWFSSDHGELIAEVRRVTEAFTQTRDYGPGRLVIRRDDGTQRQIFARYVDGLEGDPDDGMWLRNRATVRLLCEDPFWQAVTPIRREFAQEATTDYLNPYPSYGSGSVIGAAELTNPGAQDVWPTWTIRGPMTSLIATNTTTGKTFTVTYTLAAGQTITISGPPVQVRGPAGQQLIQSLGLLAGGGKPWRLPKRSTSQVTFTAAGSATDTTPGANDGTLIVLEYAPYFETA